ncbi:hypothetical protein BGX38DRAFT_1146910 [Terfezia claveryi]|nr:hypothetical protein BGX38DRAFT_1146910 [Terfezia claveryi]
MIVKVTQSEIVRKGVHSGKKVRWQQDKPYEVDAEEVAEFSRKLTADLRKAGIDLFQGGRKEDDTGSTTEEDIWEGNDPTRIEEEEEDSVEGNSNARNDYRAEEEEDAEDAEEGEGMPSGQKEYRGTEEDGPGKKKIRGECIHSSG